MTTTTEIAVIEDAPETVEPLTKSQAKALDKRIRAASDKVSTASDNLLELLEKAAAGEIHVALELPSWTAWFKDAVQINVKDRFDRKELVKLMSGKGMSQRAIAGTLGVSQKTVDRDLEGEEVQDGATVTSLDGVERPKAGKAKDVEPELDYIDAEVVDGADDTLNDAPVAVDMKAADIVSTFTDEVVNLWAAHAELTELTHEDKWTNARKRIAGAELNNLQTVISNLQAIVDDLMEQ